MPAIAVLALIVLFLAIVIGFKCNVNFGLMSMVGAFVVGVMIMGLSTDDVLAMWPTDLFMTLFTITLFFGIGLSNGTVLALTNHLIYPFRNKPALIPVVLYFVAVAIAFIGPGAVPCFVLLTPIYMMIANQIKIDYAIIPLIVTGASAGAWGPFSLNGFVTRNILTNSGFSGSEVDTYANKIWIALMLSVFLTFIVAYFFLGAYKAQKFEMEKPEPLSKKQKTTTILISILLILVAGVPFLGNFIKTEWWNTFSGWVSVELLCITLTVIALLLNLIDLKTALKNVPWNTIIMVCGVSVMVSVACDAGTISALADLVSNLSLTGINYVMAVLAGVMSFFSSSVGVVMPTCFPIINNLAGVGVNIAGLLCIVTTAAVATGCSPISTIGSLTLASLPDQNDDALIKRMTKILFILPVYSLAIVLVMCLLGIFKFF